MDRRGVRVGPAALGHCRRGADGPRAVYRGRSGTLRRSAPVEAQGPRAAQAADQVHALGYTSGLSLRSTQVASVGGDAGRGAAATAAPRAQAGLAENLLSPSVTDTQMIVRTATVNLSTDKFDDMRAALERIAAAHHGSISDLRLGGDPPNRRTLSVTLRVPVANTDAALAAVRGLGKVQQESQSSEDVTDSHRDLAVRIANARVEEARLGEILKDRTGKIADVPCGRAGAVARARRDRADGGRGAGDAQPRGAIDDHGRGRGALRGGSRGRCGAVDRDAIAQRDGRRREGGDRGRRLGGAGDPDGGADDRDLVRAAVLSGALGVAAAAGGPRSPVSVVDLKLPN